MKILVPADNYPEKYWLKYERETNPDHLEFFRGIKIPDDDAYIAFTLKGRLSLAAVKKYDFLFTDGPDVVGARLAKILIELCHQDVQLLPAVIKVDNEELEGYFVLNLLNTDSAFDLRNCLYVPLIASMPDGPKKFKRISLLNSIPCFNIFRAAESKSYVVLSDRLAQVLEQEMIKGVQFVSQLDGI